MSASRKNKKVPSTPTVKMRVQETPKNSNEYAKTVLDELATTTADEVFEKNKSIASGDVSIAAPQTAWSNISGR
jgi:hypothetical protein